ncbi:hypothetical protein ABW19_dt0201697 [Dactylella cylindrospora]|nr:hypothetical protein ABW19_dt0201697 [Dactylella cylindrospora]
MTSFRPGLCRSLGLTLRRHCSPQLATHKLRTLPAPHRVSQTAPASPFHRLLFEHHFHTSLSKPNLVDNDSGYSDGSQSYGGEHLIPPDKRPRNPRTIYHPLTDVDQDISYGIVDPEILKIASDPLGAAMEESANLPLEEIRPFFRQVYKKLAENPKLDTPITSNPPSPCIYIHGVDYENFEWPIKDSICPCCLNDDEPRILVEASKHDPDGRGVTYKQMIEEVGEWLYGDNPEEIVKGEAGRAGMSLINYMIRGEKPDGLMTPALYWYMKLPKGRGKA